MANEGRDNQFLIQGSILAAASLIVRMIGLISDTNDEDYW